jgi:hypothetical protein
MPRSDEALLARGLAACPILTCAVSLARLSSVRTPAAVRVHIRLFSVEPEYPASPLFRHRCHLHFMLSSFPISLRDRLVRLPYRLLSTLLTPPTYTHTHTHTDGYFPFLPPIRTPFRLQTEPRRFAISSSRSALGNSRPHLTSCNHLVRSSKPALV